MSNYKKTMTAFLGLAAAGFMFVAVATPVKAQTVAQLQVMIQQLQAQIASLQGGVAINPGPGAGFRFTQNLTIGSRGAEVTELQRFLVSKGYLQMPAGTAYGYFGPLTRAALARYQAANGISPAAGYFGPITRAHVNNQLIIVIPPVNNNDDDDDDNDNNSALRGGAGSLSDVDYISKLSNEEVGEGAEDIEVAGLEIEADDNSDIELVAVALNFSQGTADRDFDRYADEVTVFFEGDEVARVDAEDFEDDDNFDRTITLDRGAIIRSGERGELTVAVSGVSNIDSNDENETWTVEFESVRFRDAQGAVITDNSTGDINDNTGRTFTFEDFASAADLELRVSRGDDEINEVRTIQVDDEDNTDNVDILSFEIEIEGDSDVVVEDLSVDFTSTGAGVGEIINTARLVVDGDTIGSETVSSTTATTRTITFDDFDLEIAAGDTVEIIVEVDVNDMDGGFTTADTLSASVNPDDDEWSVEDEEGNDLGTNETTGSASSDSHILVAEGIRIADRSTEESVRDTNGDTAGGEQGTYTIVFDVTAFEDDIYIPTGATTATSSVDTDDGIAYVVENSNGRQLVLGGVEGATSDVVSSTADTSGSYYVVREGETETFTLRVTFTPNSDGFYRAQLYGINFNVGSAAAADTMQLALPASDFETGYVDINV